MFTGREYDRGLKLYYNRARYYDPKLARFISRDPIDIADDVNLYAYVGNNSVMFVDLMGTEKNNFIAEHDATDIIVKLFNDGGVYYSNLDSKWDVLVSI
jgi:RHS repeat-associated protein